MTGGRLHARYMNPDIQSQIFEESPGVWRYWLVRPSSGEVDQRDRGTFISQAAAEASAAAVIAILSQPVSGRLHT